MSGCRPFNANDLAKLGTDHHFGSAVDELDEVILPISGMVSMLMMPCRRGLGATLVDKAVFRDGENEAGSSTEHGVRSGKCWFRV